MAPPERLKLLLQTKNDIASQNLWVTIQNITKEQGIVSFWRGYFFC